jgi:hypothetical protein
MTVGMSQEATIAILDGYQNVALRNGERIMSSPVVRTRKVLKGNAMRFAAALLAALTNFVAIPNAALAAPSQHHDQVPGFYRLRVGELEVTALFDGPGVFDVNWLNGEKTKDGVLKALQDDPHLMDVADTGYLVNTGKQVILVDTGSRVFHCSPSRRRPLLMLGT